MAGAGCDAADLGRSAVDDDTVGAVLGGADFCPLADDAAKLPKRLLKAIRETAAEDDDPQEPVPDPRRRP